MPNFHSSSNDGNANRSSTEQCSGHLIPSLTAATTAMIIQSTTYHHPHNGPVISAPPPIFTTASSQQPLISQAEHLIHATAFAAASTITTSYLPAICPTQLHQTISGQQHSDNADCTTNRSSVIQQPESANSSNKSSNEKPRSEEPSSSSSLSLSSLSLTSSSSSSVSSPPDHHPPPLRQSKRIQQRREAEQLRQQQSQQQNDHQQPVVVNSQQHSEEPRPSTSSTGIVERGEEQSLADAADQGPPAKKSRSMQGAAAATAAGVQVQHQSTPKSVGQRIKETLQTSKNQSCRSSSVADTSLVTLPASPPTLDVAQVNTIRIIGQYLKNLGLQETVATLFAESGCRLEDTLAVRLREYILAGEWDHALGIVDKMSPFATHMNLLRIREKLFEEKFVDLLDKERVLEALNLLTVDFPSDPAFYERRNYLATLLYVDPKTVDVCAKTGAHRTRRERNSLISEIQQLLPSTIMLPCNRLETLLMQSWRMQCHECYLHVKDDADLCADYILEDHQCDWDQFPLFTSQVLTKHTDEVWCAAFTPCGKYLATCSRTGATHVWKVIDASYVESYKEIGRNSSSLLAWSDDGVMLAVSASEGHLADVHVYDVHSGSIFCVIENRSNDSTVISFVPNSAPNYRIVCADQMGHFSQYVLSQDEAKAEGKFEGYRIRAVHCLRNGTVLAADTHNRVRSYRFSDDTERTLIEEHSQIATFVVDNSERRVLIDTKLHGLRLWDLKTRSLIRTFIGAPHQDYIIHSAFGGPDHSYIVSGSTDECIYVWKQDSDDLVAKLSGHTARINAVAWNPCLPQLVSCADDCTVRIWSPLNGNDQASIRQN